MTVASHEGQGTTFTVTIRTGTQHLPTERIGTVRETDVDERRRDPLRRRGASLAAHHGDSDHPGSNGRRRNPRRS